MKVTIKDEGILTQYDYIDACILKGVKPIMKVQKHKRNTKDRYKKFPIYNGEYFKTYVHNFLKLNNLKVE